MMDKYYFYQSYYYSLKGLKRETRYAIREAIDDYMFEDKEPNFKDALSNSIWMLLLPTLSKSKTKYENAKGKRQANQEQNQEQTENEMKANQKRNESENEIRPSISISKEDGERKMDNNIPPIVPHRGVSASFEKFWKAYPRHEAKQRAIPALERALKKTDIDTILNAIEKQKHSDKWTKDNGQFIPHPATWLNGGCWDDEITVAESEPEKEYHPITPLTKCKVCGSRNVVTRGMYANCLNGDCYASFVWSSSAGDWKEE